MVEEGGAEEVGQVLGLSVWAGGVVAVCWLGVH